MLPYKRLILWWVWIVAIAVLGSDFAVNAMDSNFLSFVSSNLPGSLECRLLSAEVTRTSLSIFLLGLLDVAVLNNMDVLSCHCLYTSFLYYDSECSPEYGTFDCKYRTYVYDASHWLPF